MNTTIGGPVGGDSADGAPEIDDNFPERRA
jgi:hypothetical protein